MGRSRDLAWDCACQSFCWRWRPRRPRVAVEHHRTETNRRNRRTAGRPAPATPTRRNARVETPNAVLHPGRRPPAGRLHPVHRQARTGSADRPRTGRRPQDRAASTCPRASASTRRRRPSANSKAANSPIGGCPAEHQGRRQPRRPRRGAAVRSAAAELPADSRLQPRAQRANRRASASTSARHRRSLPQAGVEWDGDYHEYFTIHVPGARRSAT